MAAAMTHLDAREWLNVPPLITATFEKVFGKIFQITNYIDKQEAEGRDLRTLVEATLNSARTDFASSISEVKSETSKTQSACAEMRVALEVRSLSLAQPIM